MRELALRQIVVFISAVVPSLFLVTGCNPPKDQLAKFNMQFEAGNYCASSAFAQKHLENCKKPGGEDLLWTLQLGAVERLMGNYSKSSVFFDKSEEMLKFYDKQSTIADGLATTAVNENALPYRGEEYDGIMVNTYKALNFMAQGNMELARIEFNRALDRQRRAKETFNKEISELKKDIDKKTKAKTAYESNLNNPKTRELLAEKYPNLYAFEAYPDFINPFTTYLAGIFFALVDDYSKADTLLKESHGMVASNKYIAEDFAAIEATLEGKAPLDNTVWVIFENGLGPVKEEFRIDLPLFIATRHVRYAGIALPKLRFRQQAYPYLLIEADGHTYKTSLVASMDRVIQTEFKKDFEVTLQRAIVSATTKALAQYAFESDNSSAGTLLAVMTAAYSFATTATDVRIWTALPKNFQVARFDMPEDGRITITPPGSGPTELKLMNCNNTVIYVKIPTKRGSPLYEIMEF